MLPPEELDGGEAFARAAGSPVPPRGLSAGMLRRCRHMQNALQPEIHPVSIQRLLEPEAHLGAARRGHRADQWLAHAFWIQDAAPCANLFLRRLV
jgi:hypothetical protein